MRQSMHLLIFGVAVGEKNIDAAGDKNHFVFEILKGV